MTSTITQITATNKITADNPNNIPDIPGFEACIIAAMIETIKSRIIAAFLIRFMSIMPLLKSNFV